MDFSERPLVKLEQRRWRYVSFLTSCEHDDRCLEPHVAAGATPASSSASTLQRRRPALHPDTGISGNECFRRRWTSFAAVADRGSPGKSKGLKTGNALTDPPGHRPREGSLLPRRLGSMEMRLDGGAEHHKHHGEELHHKHEHADHKHGDHDHEDHDHGQSHHSIDLHAIAPYAAVFFAGAAVSALLAGILYMRSTTPPVQANAEVAPPAHEELTDAPELPAGNPQEDGELVVDDEQEIQEEPTREEPKAQESAVAGDLVESAEEASGESSTSDVEDAAGASSSRRVMFDFGDAELGGRPEKDKKAEEEEEKTQKTQEA